ncbi:MAG: HAD family hydrolase [Eubacterium sp.]|nr:HAD family hydrolase [Eubacterium sp.]
MTDLDGTLMRSDMTISEESVRIFNRLIDRGVLITYATARSFHSAYTITKEIGFKLPVITRNGTTFADQISVKETETSFFSMEILKELKIYFQSLVAVVSHPSILMVKCIRCIRME